MATKKPTLIVYYTDTIIPLTFRERIGLSFASTVISVTPHEVLLEDKNRRKVSIQIIGNPGTPNPPPPKQLMNGK